MPELAWAESTPVAQYLFSLRLGPLRVFPYQVTDTWGPLFSLLHLVRLLLRGPAVFFNARTRWQTGPTSAWPSSFFNARTRWQTGPPRQLLSARLRLCLVSPFYGPALSAVSLSSSPLDADGSDVAAPNTP